MSMFLTVGQYKALSPTMRAGFDQLLQLACAMAMTMNFELYELYQGSPAGERITANILANAMIKLTDSSRDKNPYRKDTQTYLRGRGMTNQQALEIIYGQLFELLDLIIQSTNPKMQVFHNDADLIVAIAHAAWMKQFRRDIDYE